MTIPPLHTVQDRNRFLARRPLVLVPGETRGWFGGESLLCLDPDSEYVGDIERAAHTLEEVFDGADDRVAVAVIDYAGGAIVRTYASAQHGFDPDSAFSSSLLVHPPGDAYDSLMYAPAFEMSREQYVAAVLRIHEEVRCGNVYVANLTYRITGESVTDPASAFAVLAHRTHGPMAALFGGPDFTIASVSPERFLSVERGPDTMRHATIEPIKGTRPRGADAHSDQAFERELRESKKERAEHVMVVDMERNDLGRISVPGSVDVEPLCDVFATPYCYQMESRVRSTLRDNATFAEVLRAVFPCGSITGAPKRAAQRVIGELELGPRGFYTGSLLVARAGRLDSSVLIRTLECTESRVVWGTGGGITIDSDPLEEWAESLLKASPVLGSHTPSAL